MGIFLVATFVAAFVQCVFTSDEEMKGVLTVHFIDKDMVLGSYMHPELDCGIHFNSTTDSLTITTLNGSILFMAEESVGPVRLVNIGGKEFVQHRTNHSEARITTDYAIPESHGRFTGIRDHNTLLGLVSGLKRLEMDRESHSKAMKESVKSVHSSPEAHILKDAAHALGDAGITGQEYPGILPFHMLALRMETAKSSYFDVIVAVPYEFEHNRNKRLASCFEDCPPSCDRNCLGMCGRRCNCWKFVCGDCCYHLGCYGHDLCCRRDFWSSSCLFPFSLRCAQRYTC